MITMIPSSTILRLIPKRHHDVVAISNRGLSNVCKAGQNVNKFTERSHTCGGLSQDNIGQRVSLFGWVKYSRFDNKIIALRDSYGTVQCVMSKDQLTKSFRKTAIHNESILKVSGVVQARPANQVSRDSESGAIEVVADSVSVLNNASKNLPILTRDNDPEQTLVNKLKYRYLDIRGHKMQEALRLRSKVCNLLRQKLYDLNFIECETPTLFRRTPGGANEFVVPTRLSNMFYSLTQSPQQLKQLLMIGGLDRYFQICRCYRDESGRTDRQPEFTQVDIELSFTSQDLVISMMSELMFDLFKNLYGEPDSRHLLSDAFAADGAIPRMDYREAFSKYGCDKPDTRFGWLIEDSEAGGLQITVPHVVDLDTASELLETVRLEKRMTSEEFTMTVGRHPTADNSTRIHFDSRTHEARKVLGQLRLAIASRLQQQLGSQQVYQGKFKFVWVTGFPLFEWDETTQTLVSSHHPFTAPTRETEHLLATSPRDVIGQHYDLVLNGQEIAGGSIRIHDANMQRSIFKDVLKLDDQTFAYFTEALGSGCPPHGGIAIGLDRLIAIILERESIRDVIAFPKSNVGRDLMSDCPHELDQATKSLYHVGGNKLMP